MEESFTQDQILNTLKTWVEYGRQTYKADKRLDELGHRGYFSGNGFAARVLKHVIAEMAHSGSEPPRCQTCQYWTRQPDKIFQPTEWQKPVGLPQITRYGICSLLDIGLHEPSEDGIAHNPSHCSEYGDTVTTGPLFGCVHHVQNASPPLACAAVKPQSTNEED